MPTHKSVMNSGRLALEGAPSSKALAKSSAPKDTSKNSYEFAGIEEEDDDNLTDNNDQSKARAIEWTEKDAHHANSALVTKEKATEMVSGREKKRKERRKDPAGNKKEETYDTRGVSKPKALEAGIPERKALEYGSVVADDGHNDSLALVTREKLGRLEHRGHSRSKEHPKHRFTREHGGLEHGNNGGSGRRPREIEGAPSASRRKELTYGQTLEEGGDDDETLVSRHKQDDEPGQLMQNFRKEAQAGTRSRVLEHATTKLETRKPREIEAGPSSSGRKELTYGLENEQPGDSGTLVRTSKDDPRRDSKPEKAQVRPREADVRKIRELEAGASTSKRKELTYAPEPEGRIAEDVGALIQTSKRGSGTEEKLRGSQRDFNPNTSKPEIRKPRELEAGPPRSNRKELTYNLPQAPTPPHPSDNEVPSDSDHASTSDPIPPPFKHKSKSNPNPNANPNAKAKGKAKALPEPSPPSSPHASDPDPDSSDYTSASSDDKATRTWKRDKRKYRAAMLTYERQQRVQAQDRELSADGGQLVRVRSPSPKLKEKGRDLDNPSLEERERVVARRRRGDVVRKKRYETETESESDSEEDEVVRRREKEVRMKEKKMKAKAKSRPVAQPINISLSNVNNVTM